MKAVRTWILLADGARARILENTGPGHGLTPVEGMVFQGDHGATHDLVSDREGRSYSFHGPGRSAVQSRSDPHRDLKTVFAHSLADVLAAALEQKSFDRLIIAAAPVTLGDLRAAMSDQVRAKVTGEVAHDLTKIPNSDVADHLKAVLAA